MSGLNIVKEHINNIEKTKNNNHGSESHKEQLNTEIKQKKAFHVQLKQAFNFDFSNLYNCKLYTYIVIKIM